MHFGGQKGKGIRETCLHHTRKKLFFYNQKFYGEVTERLKVHAWKACVRKRTLGSNPSLSAIVRKGFLAK
jgi:hypothetical protein